MATAPRPPSTRGASSPSARGRGRTLLRREESYAVHALLDIAGNEGTNAAEIADRLRMPPAFLAKVLRKLVVAGYVESQMGRSGGVRLAVDLSTVTLLDVVEKVSGPLLLDTCQTQVRCATQRRTGYCGLKLAWLSATREIRAVLANVRLADLAAPPTAG
jgi:Rrf2 family protein